MTSNGTFAKDLDNLFAKLMKEAYPDIPDAETADDAAQKLGFVDKLRLFDSGVRWVQVKNRLTPEDDTDEFAESRKKLIGGTRRRVSPASQNGRAN